MNTAKTNTQVTYTPDPGIEIKGSWGNVPKRSQRYHAPAAAQRPELKIEADGDILWA